MMGRKEDTQGKLEFIDIDALVPENYILRKIQEKLDFSFIYTKMEKYYSPVGRKSIDPVILFKMLLIGYLFNIDSERQLELEVRLNVGYRWFLGLDLTDPVPDHSVFSQNRRRRFKDGKVFQEIFDHVVQLCLKEGLVTGEVMVTDSTHIKASAAKDKVQKVEVTKTPSQYLNTLEEETKKIEEELEKKRKESGKQKRGRKPNETKTQTASIVTTDMDAGVLNRPGKPHGPHYLAHTTIDAAHGIIVDIHPTAGNVNDCEPFVERLKVTKEKFNLTIQKAGADRGYDTTQIHHGLTTLDITGYISPTESKTSFKTTSYKDFTYDREQDHYTCPNQKVLPFTHLAKSQNGNYVKTYAAKAKDCKGCPFRGNCFGQTARRRTIARPIAHELLEANAERAKTSEYKRIQKLRRVWCEGTFGTLKMKHNLYKTYKRGMEKILEQCLFSAMAINLKRMIKGLN